MAFHNILSKVDRALVSYIIAQGAGTVDDTFPAKRSLEKSFDCTICWSEHAVEDPPYTSTFMVRAQVQCRTLAAVDPNEGDTHPEGKRISSDERVAAVFDCFRQDVDSAGNKLGQAITAAGRANGNPGMEDLQDLTILNVTCRSISQGYDADSHSFKQLHGNAWVDTLELEVLCCPSKVD